MTFSVRGRVAACAVASVFAPLLLAAQGPAVGDGATDSSAARSRATTTAWVQRGWVSAGAGIGSYPYGSLDGVASGWYSVGPVATGVRLGTTGQWVGEQRSDQAFLVGARTQGSRAFLLGAIGTSKVASSRTCDCGVTSRGSSTEMAYALEAHANVPVIGLGVTMFGVLGPALVHYNAFALTLDVGWFGDW